MAFFGTGMYIASANDSSELRYVQIQQSGTYLTPFNGYNLSDRTFDGLTIAVAGTSAILGTQRDPLTQEMVLFDVKNGVTGVTPAWYYEASGSVVGIDMDPNRCYAFLSVFSGHNAFQVVNMRNKTTLPRLNSQYDSASGLSRGLVYDPLRDRVYVLTDNAVIIFKPAAAGATCP